MDLRRHAELSLRFLEGSVNEGMGDMPYFWIDFLKDPPEFAHCVLYDDVQNFGRWLYAIAAAQHVSGTDAAEETRRAMVREIDRRLTGPYGLVYTSEYSERFYRSYFGKHSWLWGDRSVLQGWVLSYRFATDQRERDELKRRIDGMVDGLRSFAVQIGSCSFFPSHTPTPEFCRRDDMVPPQAAAPHAWGAMYGMDIPSDPRCHYSTRCGSGS